MINDAAHHTQGNMTPKKDDKIIGHVRSRKYITDLDTYIAIVCHQRPLGGR